jgi:hypothetical protein
VSRLSRALLLPALFGALLLPITPASAGDTSNVPNATFRVKDVRINGYTGNIIVAARVSCTGTGTMTWSAQAQQDLSAAGSKDVPCDGVKRRSRIALDPADGRFHPGAVSLIVGYVVCGPTACQATGQSLDTTV